MPNAESSSRVFFITPDFTARGGREQLSDLLLKGLQSIQPELLEIYRLTRPAAKKTSFAERLAGRIDGITSGVEKDLVRRLTESPPGCIFINGSNLGRLARLIRKANLTVPIVIFYHNVEARFFFDALRASPSARAIGVFVANTIAERWASLYSDFRVMLNERDARLHARIYRRTATNILPMALRDQYDPLAIEGPRPFDKPYALFVGGAFYANVEGMAWYAQKVAADSPVDTVVIGRGMEAHRSRLESCGGVHVLGEVDELAAWYAHAQIVVAPILSGSGMKTKTAEALMHGKSIAGTAEAFEGYNTASKGGLAVCDTPEDFLIALNLAAKDKPGVDADLRSEYVRNHSEEALEKGLNIVLSKVMSLA